MDFVTVGDIADKLDIDRDAASYAIRKAGVKPVGRAGIVRLFPGNAVGTVRQFIKLKRQYRHAGRIVRRCRAQVEASTPAEQAAIQREQYGL